VPKSTAPVAPHVVPRRLAISGFIHFAILDHCAVHSMLLMWKVVVFGVVGYFVLTRYILQLFIYSWSIFGPW
jgi:hypothetical protein